MIQLAPSMLSADFLHLEKDVEFVNANADLFHLDIMDGSFVPNISYGFPVVEAISRKARKPLDAHLMIVHPEKYFARFASAGADMLSFHLEAAIADGSDPSSLAAAVKAEGMQAGIAVNPDMPLERLIPYLGDFDFVVLMSVFAGFGGQKFIPESIDRLKALKKEILARKIDCRIEVDGGIGPSNASILAQAGADILVAGSSVFKSSDPAATASAIRSC